MTKIIVLFLKDHTSAHELHRSVLKYIKTIVSFIPAEYLKGEMGESMANAIYSLQTDKKTHNKHNMLIKKVLSKLIKKLSVEYIMRITP